MNSVFIPNPAPPPASPASARRDFVGATLTGLFAAAVLALSAAPASAADVRTAFPRIRPQLEHSVVMVKVTAHPQMRVRGVIQPPRTFELEGPATVVASGGIIVSSLSIFDPIRGFPPREGVEFQETIYSSVGIFVDGREWIVGRMAATSESDDLIFFVPENPATGARLQRLPLASGVARVEVFDEYLDVTRAPAAFDRGLIARISTIAGTAASGRYVFVTSLSAGAPLVDADGAMLGLGVRIPSPDLPATSVIMLAPRILEIASEKGLVLSNPAPAPPP